MKYKLEILIKSFEYQLVKKATKQLLEAIDLIIMSKNMNNLWSEFDLPEIHFLRQKIFQFPKSIKKYTVIRSPHIDKKARDQFEIQEYKTLIELKFATVPSKGNPFRLTPESFLCFSILENIKNTKFLGIQMQIKMHSKTFGPICS
jgi:ribosomal protein S10